MELDDSHTTVIGPTDDSGLGFTAQDVLGNIVGNYPDTLVWSAAEGPAYYEMAGTSVGLSIDVHPRRMRRLVNPSNQRASSRAARQEAAGRGNQADGSAFLRQVRIAA